MSITPTTPNFSATAKNFWARREGTTGKIVIVVGCLAAAGMILSFWNLILPFLIATTESTITLCLDAIALGIITSPLWSKRVRLLVSTVFKLSMRWSTQLLIETDPIGILRESILDMKKNAVVLMNAVEKVAKSVQGLRDAIDKNKGVIQQAKGSASSAARLVADTQAQLAGCKDPTQAMTLRVRINKLQLQTQGYQQTAGIADQSIQQEQKVLDSASTMYEQLLRYQSLSDFKVEAFTQNANMLEERRKVILAGSEGLSVMQKLLGGDPVQQDLIDRDIEYLNTEASDVMGALNNFNRYSDKYLTDMDIQNGAAASKGADIFAELDAKMNAPLVLPSAVDSGVSVPMDTVQDDTGIYVPVSSDYSQYFKK